MESKLLASVYEARFLTIPLFLVQGLLPSELSDVTFALDWGGYHCTNMKLFNFK